MRSIISVFFFLSSCLYLKGQQVNEYPFHVSKTGNGDQSVLLLPGFACSGDVWSETVESLRKNYTCYTLTMAGFAGTAPKAGASFKNWEKGIVQFIRDNHISKPIIIGHSMGGGLAMAIASDYPDLPEKIIIVDALPCIAALTNNDFKSNDTNNCSGLIRHITGMTDDQFQQMQNTAAASLTTNKNMQEVIAGWSVKSDRETFAAMYCDFSNTDLRDNISRIKCPALVLLESYFINFTTVIEEQYKNLKKADLRYATKGLHFIMYDDTEWYIAQIRDFLNAAE
ncbi:MAG: alpha/beta hydrolase [Flavobacteriia bacterium 40-80]|mgnify:FL=1|nr:MAG: alpha/beta hydrolase [Flavobacteriia bacterium 40-80]